MWGYLQVVSDTITKFIIKFVHHRLPQLGRQFLRQDYFYQHEQHGSFNAFWGEETITQRDDAESGFSDHSIPTIGIDCESRNPSQVEDWVMR